MTRSKRHSDFDSFAYRTEKHSIMFKLWTKRIRNLILRSLRLQFGRCSVRTYYAPALEILRANQQLFSTFIEHKVSLDQAEEVSHLSVLERSSADEMAVLPVVRAEQDCQDHLCALNLVRVSARSIIIESYGPSRASTYIMSLACMHAYCTAFRPVTPLKTSLTHTHKHTPMFTTGDPSF